MDELAVIVSVCDSLTAPVPMPVRLTDCTPESSLTEMLLMTARVGGLFTAFTETVNEREKVLLVD